MASALGLPLMPWQRLVADVGTEYDPETGYPHYKEVQVTVPRRGGKTSFVLSFELDRCLGMGGRQVGAYTAQDGGSARKLLLTDQLPIIEASPLAKTIKHVRRANDNTGLLFTNGSLIDVLPTSATAGHGRTFDFAVADEAFADTDDRREQSLLPTLATKRHAQFVIVSTAGTQSSTWLRRKVEIGRRAATEDSGSGIAYFEWSAPDDADPSDPATWWAAHPALGHTIEESWVAHCRETMEDGEFRRAYLNQWTETNERIIPALAWDAVNSPKVAGGGDMTFGVDVNEERSAAAIVAVSADHVVEVVEHRPGIGWLIDAAAEIDTANPGSCFAADATGPVGSLLPELGRRVGKLVELKGGELARASAAFYDAVADNSVRVRRHPSMDEAVAGAARRLSGDSWAWSRKAGTSDSSPLVAATVALWVASQGSFDPAMNVW